MIKIYIKSRKKIMSLIICLSILSSCGNKYKNISSTTVRSKTINLGSLESKTHQ